MHTKSEDHELREQVKILNTLILVVKTIATSQSVHGTLFTLDFGLVGPNVTIERGNESKNPHKMRSGLKLLSLWQQSYGLTELVLSPMLLKQIRNT